MFSAEYSGTIISFLFLGVLVLIAVYDIIAGASGGQLHSASAVIRDWSARYPLLPFAGGVLVGHLFW